MDPVAPSTASRTQKTRTKGWIWALSLFCLALLLLHLVRFFLRVPEVWPDESLFAAPAIDLLRHGKMGTPLLAEVLPGIGDRTYWMPPFYFLSLASFFKVFGISIVAMRAFTLIVSIGTIALTLLLAIETGAGTLGAALCFCVLAIHESFESTLVVGRMESLVMLFLFGSSLLLAKELNRSSQSPSHPIRIGRVALAGLLCGFAAITHPFGIVGCAALGTVILLNSPRETTWPRRVQLVLAAAASAILVVIPWVIYILQSPADFKGQFGSQMARKAQSVAQFGLWELIRFNLEGFSTKGWMAGLLLLIAGLVGFLISKSKKCGAWVAFWLQIFILLMLIRTREIWYPAYLVPLTGMGLGILVNRESSGHLSRRISQSLCLIAWLGFGFWLLRGSLHRIHENVAMTRQHQSPTAYLPWANEISQALPAGKRVLISSIPDPTMALFSREDLTLRHFSPVQIEPELYDRYIASSDYIVFSGRTVDGHVEQYAQAHGKLIQTVSVPNDPGFKAFVYQMHP